jgi:hypothetical protein
MCSILASSQICLSLQITETNQEGGVNTWMYQFCFCLAHCKYRVFNEVLHFATNKIFRMISPKELECENRLFHSPDSQLRNDWTYTSPPVYVFTTSGVIILAPGAWLQILQEFRQKRIRCQWSVKLSAKMHAEETKWMYSDHVMLQ